MDSQFWIKSWKEKRTGFHQENFHDKLVQYFPLLNPQPGENVLVPLCGKSKDLIWLHQHKLNVHGIELYEKAVEDFFPENGLPSPAGRRENDFVHYSFKNIQISCGDFFKFDQKNAYDLIYDRAALVALPQAMRKNYARVITQALKKGGKYLLIVYDYDQSEMEGPPFHVGEDEIRELYGDAFSIRLIESENAVKEGPRLSALKLLKQNVYILTAEKIESRKPLNA